MQGEEGISTKTINSKEVRIVDPVSGGEKGQKESMHHLIPVQFLTALAILYGKGMQKYAERNWERGYKWSLSYSAAKRHLDDCWMQGEDYDPELGSHHLINAIWHLIALYCFQLWNKGTDDLMRHRSNND